ncbi:carbohydrate ABC transporter permease [Streptosporangium roseum]|uniref:Trehalose/maltose transport inner membrane protein n=1 Tax=Streptosporangium roseum (strain ATCC 12428 / DSM 43021 / JCM 3005 / KCTC 9067 / NCIMB 10171 / NRRL 2505 / NI 9100) TaxID=479432 RepID=D2BAV1_STRRD|nr:sugar ABC transporter permease [Streptosporangium roseum]ACZ91715.1 trehalose/maltose transport inner membrane protein [Streptosporangium roseum DSM 43021]
MPAASQTPTRRRAHEQDAPVPAPRLRARPRRPTALWPYLLITPTLAGTAYLLLYPLIRSVVISFQHFRTGELIRGGAALVGLDNYREVLGSPEFWAVVRRTLVWTAVNVVLIMVISTAVALMITRLRRRMRLAVMSGLVLTWATPVLAATTIFQWLFQSRLGVVNWLLVTLGFESFRDYTWFADGTSTFVILVALVVWQSVPFAALTLYAGLTTIPAELYEAARIDGATGRQVFADVTFPILRPLFGLIASLEVIWVFKCFAQIWAISRGGPGGATTTLPVYAFQVAQSLHKYDLGSAISTLTVLILVAVLITHLRRMLKHEGEQL